MSAHRPLIRTMASINAGTVRADRRKSTVRQYNRQQSEVSNMMSVNITKQLAPNARRFGESFRTLYRWKDSVYKLLWRHMLTYYVIYVSLTLLYYFGLKEDRRRVFRQVTTYITRHQNSFNLMIMLGFFTSSALQRMFNMQSAIPGTAKVTSNFILSLKPNLPGAKALIDLYSRWTVLSWLLAFRVICKPLRDMFPDMITLQRKDFITEWERIILERVETKGETTPRALIVLDWMLLLLRESMLNEKFIHRSCYAKNLEALLAFKKGCGNTIKLSAKNMPYAVIQAVIISVYFFGMVTILARELPSDDEVRPCITSDSEFFNSTSGQHNATLDSMNCATAAGLDYNTVEFVFSIFPIMPAMKFFIFFSWLTFGRAAVNPFGDDYTDIDIIQLLNAHLEDAKRLKRLYSDTLEDIFPNFKRSASAFVDEPPEARKNQQIPKTAAEDCQIITVIHHG